MMQFANKRNYSEEEFDLMADINIGPYMRRRWQAVKSSRRMILSCGIVLAVLYGMSFMLFPFRYVAISKVVPEWNNTNKAMSSNLGLSALVKNVSTDETVAIRPEMFPAIISSDVFVSKLFNMKVGEGNLYDYVRDTRQSCFDFLSGDSEQALVTKYISNAVTAIVDTKTCLMTLWVKLPDRNVALDLSSEIISRLKLFVTDYMHENAAAQFDASRNSYEKACEEYLRAQDEYVRFIDSHSEPGTKTVAALADSLKVEAQHKFYDVKERFNDYNAAKAEMEFDPPVLSIIHTPEVTQSKLFGVIGGIFNAFLVGILLSLISMFFFKRLK